MRKLFLCLCSVVTTSILFISCDSSTEPEDYMPDNGKNIQVVYPIGGESFTVGQTVTIQCKVNANKVASILPAISKDGGMTFSDIVAKSIQTEAGGGGQLLTCQWVIGQEADPVTYDSTITNCKIKVSDYDNQVENDQSGLFTVSP